ncbi:MAG: hypothetical protein JST12_14695 [Armatimonadetes bacterium]|nr:hypothetical protein [Armatimonadota bacterium]
MLQQFLNTTRIAQITSEIEDIRGIPTDLLGLQRVPVVDCDQDEIWMRQGGRTISADIIADGAEAVIKSMPQVRLELEHVPNIKGGRALNQTDLQKLIRLETSGLPGDYASANSMLNRHVDDALRGCKLTMNFIIWGMLQNSLSYDKNGFKVTNFNWGTPTDLVVTPAALWTDTTNGKPITDVNTLAELGRVKYGVRYDRITLSTTALRNASKTDEFKTQAANRIAVGGSTTVAGALLTAMSIEDLKKIAGAIWGLEVVIYDDTMDIQAVDGTITATRFLAVNRVVLDSTSNDNNRNVMDFGNAPVDEATVASIIGHKSPVIGSLTAGERGPLAYAEGEFNPPRIAIWAVTKGFARKHKETATAVLIVA